MYLYYTDVYNVYINVKYVSYGCVTVMMGGCIYIALTKLGFIFGYTV